MGTTTTFNTCMGNGCHAGCIHKTYVKDGKIMKIEKVVYPDGEEGVMCVKGIAGVHLPSHPDRLKYPLKRAGKRGEGKWTRITWDQALDEIADIIKDIRAKYGPAAVSLSPVWSSTNPASGISTALGLRLRNLLEATDLNLGMPVDSNIIFASYFTYGAAPGAFADPRTLIEGNTKYVIIWGTNPAETSFRLMKYLNKVQQKGVKLVDVGLMYDATAKRADWWIPVNAGSDIAVALAMIGVIVDENLHDEVYITKYTNGPFLVRQDNGKLLRESDLFPEGDPHKYIVWGLNKNKPESVVPYTDVGPAIKPALTGTYEISGVVCRPAFQLLLDLAHQYPPDKAERISGVPSDSIVKLAREYASAKPASIIVRFGLRYKNSGNTYRILNTLGAITGNIGTKGGGPVLIGDSQSKINAPGLEFNDKSIIFPTEARPPLVPVAHSFQCIITGEPYPIKAMILYGTNLLHTLPNRQRWIEQILPNLDLVVVNDIFMTATADYADYVLPDCTVYERDDIDVGYDGYIVLLEKAIEPMYECKPPIYFWTELAKRLGLGHYFDKSMDEWMEIRLATDNPSIVEIDPPLTLKRLKKEKMVRANIPDGIHHPFLDRKFPSPSGRIEFYNEELAPAGDALPVFREQIESPRSELAKKYPLVFNTANNKYFAHTMFSNESSIHRAYKKEPYLNISPQDAKKRGICDGDVVRVYNDRGSCVLKAAISTRMPPGVVNIPHGWWPRHFIEGHLTDLLLPLASEETRDKAREIFWEETAGKTGVKIFTSTDGWHPHNAWMAYSPDVIFDCLCEVEKLSIEKKTGPS